MPRRSTAPKRRTASINIITKKGVGGNAALEHHVAPGLELLRRLEDRASRRTTARAVRDGRPTDARPDRSRRSTSTRCSSARAAIRSPRGSARNATIFRDGRHQETELSVSGGTGHLNYYAERQSARRSGRRPRTTTAQNYSGAHEPRPRPDADVHASRRTRLRTPARRNSGCDAGCGGYTWTTLLGTPATTTTRERHGFHSLLPYQYDQTFITIGRTLIGSHGSLRIDHTPFTWFQQHLSLGRDRTREENDDYAPRIDSLVYTVGSDALGYRSVQDRSIAYNTIDYSASAIYDSKPTFALHHVGRRAVLPQLRRLRRRPAAPSSRRRA